MIANINLNTNIEEKNYKCVLKKYCRDTVDCHCMEMYFYFGATKVSAMTQLLVSGVKKWCVEFNVLNGK